MSDHERAPLFTDGVVVDQVAEFAYFPGKVLRELYSFNSVGYVDSVARFIQLVATCPKLLFSRHINADREATAKLRDALAADGRVASSPQSFSAQNRSLALVETYSRWSEIEGVLRSHARARDAIHGLAQREFRNCFLAPADRQQSMSHYVAAAEAKRLFDPLRSSLLTDLRSLGEGVPMDEVQLGDWLDRMVTTHYQIFFDHTRYSIFQYAPGVTRCDLAFVIDTSDQEPARTVTWCIAAKVLEKVQLAGARDKLIPCLLDWCNSDKGLAVCGGFAKLSAGFPAMNTQERMQILEHIKAILESEPDYSMGLVLGFAGRCKSLITGGEPDPKSASLKAPPQLRWLWHLRQPHAIHRVQTQIEDLIRN